MDAGEIDEALALSTRSVSVYESLGEQSDVIEAKNLQGALLASRGETERARGIHEEALAIAQSSGHSAGMQNALFHLGCLDAGRGRLAEARRAWIALDEMRAKEPSPLGELTSASLLVVLAAEEPSPAHLGAAVVKLKDARDRVTSVPDLHAGPAVAWRIAAKRAHEAGDPALSDACASELTRELDGRQFHA
jgi:hypothetical protein